MANHISSADFHFYQAANAEAEKVRENFIIRIHEFDVIMDDIRRQPTKGSVQHFLLLGRRGSGKSTLLKRLQIEIEADVTLAKRYVVINLAEEQANIYKLHDLLEEIINELDYQSVSVDTPVWQEDEHFYSRNLFAALHQAIERSGKKVILLLDNIDRIFENLKEEASLLREYLLNYNDLKIIGGSTKMTEHFWKYNKPFYEFLRVLELKPLTGEEIKTLLLNWSEKSDLQELKDFVKNKPGQLETIRILTDGLPRTLQFFVSILLTRTQETGYEYLRLIMDSVTPLYQERLNSLPPSQRKIVLQMAFLWEATGSKELAEVTKMDTKLISAQLKQLTEKGIAEKIATQTKNHLYRLSERFFNLWLIFTQGSPREKRKAKYLTIFLENFYNDEEEFNRIATQHLQSLDEGKLSPDKAALLTKAIAQSKFINFFVRDELIRKTLAIKNIADELRHQLPPTTREVCDDVFHLIGKEEYKMAMKIAETIEQEDGVKDYLMGAINKFGKKYPEAERYFLSSLDKGVKASADMLAGVYVDQKKDVEAEKYYLIAINFGFDRALLSLGRLYERQGKDVEAEKYYLMAIDKNIWDATVNLGMLCNNKNDYRKAEKYFSVGLGHEIQGSALGLALNYYYQNINKNESAILIQKERELMKEGEATLLDTFEIIVRVWCGDFEGLEKQIQSMMNKKKILFFDWLLMSLLIHYQVNLVYKVFTGEHGAELRERYEPLFYVASILAEKNEHAILQIPPELTEMVNKILHNIKHDQEIFYGTKND